MKYAYYIKYFEGVTFPVRTHVNTCVCMCAQRLEMSGVMSFCLTPLSPSLSLNLDSGLQLDSL